MRRTFTALFVAALLSNSAYAADTSNTTTALIDRIVDLSSQLARAQAELEARRSPAAVAPVAVVSPTAPAAAPTPQQLDGAIRSWIAANPDFVYETVNQHLAKKAEADRPKASDFAQRSKEIFENGGVKVGAPDTPTTVRLVMFADYNCSWCRKMAPVVERLLADNPDLQVVYRDLPILSPTSRPAAQAARAAELQGKFEAYHNELYKFETITEASLADLAARLGLDLERWKKDAASPAVAGAVTADATLAESLRIRGTPFFYLDGSQSVIPGAAPIEEMQKAIEAMRLKKLKG